MRTGTKLYKTLSHGLLESHPEDAARVLETLPEEDVLAVLAAAAPRVSAETLRHAAPHRAASLLARMERDRAGAVVDGLGADAAANVLRRMDAGARDALLDSLAAEPARALRAVLRFPEGTAGALMDPRVLALPGDLTAEEAHAHLREAAENVRYNLYVVDREQVLTGVLNLRELLLAGRKDLLGSIARADVLSLSARADRHAILTHPAWRDARSVPVVDERGVYLGAVRYRTLRELESGRRDEEHGAGTTVEALGELYSTGIASILGALATVAAHPLPEGARREA